jgi:hypothetical protein
MYPHTTREQLGAELLDVVEQRLRSIYGSGGQWAVCRNWPQLWLDAIGALGSEYLDCLSGHRRGLANCALGCLLVTAVVWTLVILCLAIHQTWALSITDWSTPLTMTLAFGAPVAAAAISYVSIRGASEGELPSRTTFYTSVIAAVATWSLLLTHL